MYKLVLISALTIFAGIGFSACSENMGVNSNDNTENGIYSNELSASVMKSNTLTLPIEEISDSEIASLTLMREEEKLARDVYSLLYDKYGLRVFGNINKSEQRHTDAIKNLLEKYNLPDPVKSDERGVYTSSELTALFNELMTRGNISEIEALQVGALIEEVDIADLQKGISEQCDNQDILFVYNNLMKASEQHLRAFTRNLAIRGVTYSPVKLSAAQYNSIIENK